MLEAVGGLRRRALDEQKVGLGKPIQRRLQRRLRRVRRRRGAAHTRNRAQAPRRSARPHARRRADRAARRATAARSAGSLARRPARRAPTGGASPPRRTAARRRCARSPLRRRPCGSACCAAISPTMRRDLQRDRAATSEMTLWCERTLQGGRNSGRVVATMSSGACAPRSASARMRSSEVGSAQCRSSKASTTGCVRAPARIQAVIAASCRRRNSSGANFAARSSGSGISTSGASRGAYSAGSRPIRPQTCSRGRRGAVRRAASAPKRCRPHSAIGCSGVFCRSCDDDPFDPGVRRLAEPGVKLLDQPRLAEAGLADDQRRTGPRLRGRAPSGGVSSSSSSSRPTKRRQSPRAAPPAAAARANDAIERHRRRHALELMRALVLDDEQPGGLPLDASR